MKSIIRLLPVVLVASLFLVSCNRNKNQQSSVTGWKYNDPTGANFTVKPGYKLKTPPGMVAIEGGSFTIGEKGEFITAQRDNRRRRITVSSFFMDQYEIRNVDWREYTNWMTVVFGRTAPELVKAVEPDYTVWREEMAYNEPYLQNYFTHPAFDQYPVVGVTWEQAVDYCAWRTDRVNELALVNAGIIAAPNFASLEGMDQNTIANDFVFNTQKYLLQAAYQPAAGAKPKAATPGSTATNGKVDMSDGILFSDFRLPTEAEWEFAAYAIKAGKDGMVPEGRIYPWSGAQVRNPNKRELGRMQANFVRGRGDMMGTSGSLNDRATITAPVNFYYPNDFGLYNMAGNVNEWVLDVYRPTSFDVMAEYNSFRGNVYSRAKQVGNEPGVYEIDKTGRIAITFEFDDDKRSFKDGDPESQITFSLGQVTANPMDTMDITDVLRPVIDDKTRVYKGGSWKDRIYWLNPSTRRYMQQNECANDVGFRCAMSMIGNIDQVVKK